MESLIFLVSSYLPGEKRDHLSFPSFPLLLYFHLNIIVRVLFFVSTPGDLTRMPSNTVAGTTAFKGSDYTDSPGNRMVRQMWEEPASGISIYGTTLGFTVNGDVSQRFMTQGSTKVALGDPD